MSLAGRLDRPGFASLFRNKQDIIDLADTLATAVGAELAKTRLSLTDDARRLRTRAITDAALDVFEWCRGDMGMTFTLALENIPRLLPLRLDGGEWREAATTRVVRKVEMEVDEGDLLDPS